MTSPMLFEDREFINIAGPEGRIIRHIGVALDNQEAQDLIEEDLRVFCDAQGPYLVVRLPENMPIPSAAEIQSADLVVQPLEWSMNGNVFKGVTCWLKSFSSSREIHGS